MKANKSNYKALEKWLKKEQIEYYKLNDHQYRILGDVAILDIWPARMTCHVIQTEAVDPNKYFKLNYHFDSKQLNKVLQGEKWS